MIQLKKITLKDFMSFSDETFEFENGAPKALQGENLTDEGQKSNGSGKSALQEALYRLWVGTSIRKGIRDKDLIRNGKKESVISCTLIDTQTKEEIFIQRTIKLKGSENVKITLDGKDCSDMYATVRDANKGILEDILCTTKEDIDNVYIINSEKYTSFFFSSDRDKKELIARFSGADVIVGVDEFVKSDVESLEKDIAAFESDKQYIQGSIDTVQEQIDSFSIESEQEAKNKRIETIKTKIDSYILENKETLSAVATNIKVKENIKAEISQYKAKLKEITSGFDESEFDSIVKQINEVNEVSADIEEKKKEAKKILNDTMNRVADLQNKIRGSIECPNCSHVFVPGKDVDVDKTKLKIQEYEGISKEVESEINSFKGDLQETNEMLQLLKSQKREIQDQIDAYERQIQNVKNDIRKLENNLGNTESTIERQQNAIKGNKEEIKRLEERIKDVEGEEINDPTDKLNKKIKELKKDIKAKDKKIQEVQDRMFEVKQWIHNFKQFFTYLTNASLKTIEQETNKYLHKMRSDLSIQIEGVKINADGSLRERITPTVLRKGFPVGSFGKFSGGERVRMDAANLIARQSIINETHPKGGIDLIFVDEVFDKIDGLGMDNLLKSLKELHKTILITTHITTNLGHDAVRVVKENGTSRIEK